MIFKKLWTWLVAGALCTLFIFALLFSTIDTYHQYEVSAPAPAPTPDPEDLLERFPPAAGPANKHRPIEIPPSKAYVPPSAPPSASVRPPEPKKGDFKVRPLDRTEITGESKWPDKNRQGAFEQLRSANMAFNVDNKFNVTETGKAKVVIDFSKKLDVLKDELAKDGKRGGITGGAPVQVSKVVIANIIAQGLTVTPITPNEQAVSDTEPTTWLWDLRADEPGTYKVRITLTASIIIDGRATNRFLQVHDETVVIEIRPEQQVMGLIEKHWQWAFSSLLVPIGIWLWRRYRKQRTEP